MNDKDTWGPADLSRLTAETAAARRRFRENRTDPLLGWAVVEWLAKQASAFTRDCQADSALAALRESSALADELAASQPENPDFAASSAELLSRLALAVHAGAHRCTLFEDDPRRFEAATILAEACVRLRAVCRAHPKRFDLAVQRAGTILSLIPLAAPDEQARALGEAAFVVERLRRACPGHRALPALSARIEALSDAAGTGISQPVELFDYPGAESAERTGSAGAGGGRPS